jgi:polyribonucleotide nucleotidyltransferase
LFILGEMAKVIAAPRPELSKYAPRIVTLKINPEKIGAVIGPGGKNIKKIVEESGCEINIEDDGTVNIYSVSEEGMKIARDAISGMTAEAEIGKIYRGRVVTIKEFGAFVEFLPGKDGLVHVSELANFRVKSPEDIVKMGDEIWVKCLGVDEKGRVRLSRKAAMAERDKELGGTGGGERPPEGMDSGEQEQGGGGMAPSQGHEQPHHQHHGHSHGERPRRDRGGGGGRPPGEHRGGRDRQGGGNR